MKLTLLFASLCAMALFAPITAVHAQTLAWVSPNGNDTNTCSQTSPCAHFEAALAVSGATQVNCLGSGNYGAANITTSMIIDCGEGNVGEIALNALGNNTPAITINTSTPNAVIVLRHLSINGNGNNGNGIDAGNFGGALPSGTTLIVEHCVIHGFHGSVTSGNGIYFAPSNGRAQLQISDTLFYDNTNAHLQVTPSSGVIASVVLNRDEFSSNPAIGADGIFFTGAGIVAGTMRDSVVAENSDGGFVAASGQVYFTIEESSIIDNLNVGIDSVSGGSHLNVGASTIGGNGTGVHASNGGTIVSFGNNQLNGNGANGSFTSTMPLQ